MKNYYISNGGESTDVTDITTIPDMIAAITALSTDGGGKSSDPVAIKIGTFIGGGNYVSGESSRVAYIAAGGAIQDEDKSYHSLYERIGNKDVIDIYCLDEDGKFIKGIFDLYMQDSKNVVKPICLWNNNERKTVYGGTLYALAFDFNNSKITTGYAKFDIYVVCK